MKTLSIRALGLLLVLGAQIFAQRFTAAVPDVFRAGYATSEQTSGYFPHVRQSAALGEKNSLYANIMLLGGHDTAIVNRYPVVNVNTYNVVSSYGNIIGSVLPITSFNIFINAKGDTVRDNNVVAVVVLDSLSNERKTATVLFSSLKKLIIMQIALDDANRLSSRILKDIDMPESVWQTDDSYDNYGSGRRLALLGASQKGAYKTYHLAIGNPYSKSGPYAQSGRVDFFSLNENLWDFSQLNYAGLASDINGLFFEARASFGTDLVSIGDLDKNGYNELAVLLPASHQYPYSAIYIFFMDNEWTPSAKAPVILTGNSMPWVEKPERKQNCKGLGHAYWENGGSHLLVACNTELTSGNTISKSILIKDLILDSSGNILNASVFFEEEKVMTKGYYIPNYETNSNPLPLKNHKNNLHAVLLSTNGPITFGTNSFINILSVMDADYSKNYLLEAGKPEMVVNLDSLFYKSGTSEFSAKTLFGLVQCEIQNNNLLCEGEENAIGSWSALELSGRSECDPYRECKRKDTIYVYVRSQDESQNTALRIPKNMVIPFFRQVNLGDAKSLSYFRNPNLQGTGISRNVNGLKLSTTMSGNSNELSIIPFSQNEGIDTLVFSLSISATTDNYPVYLHIADTSKILENAIPGNPGEDTVWNTAQKRYIALPSSDYGENIYTYDIEQNTLGTYAEIIGNYLHILKVDVAEVYIAYTKNAQIKQRKITLMPEPKAKPEPQEPSFAASGSFNRNLSAVYTNGGLQISGINGEFELRAYSFKGEEIQRTRAGAKGSVFVKLRRNTPQIVQIKSGNQKIVFYIPPYATAR
ncbi:MAG: integrin alpha [Candidatus Fibromonas sp.]|jgi:hypothetical protein|nr:integrin alpha [Candidatus Fibromonas sp.]